WHVEDLAPGRHLIKLTFYGKVMRDLRANGPFLVRNLVLQTLTPPPDGDELANAAVDPVLETRPYRWNQFTDTAINAGNELLQEKQRLLVDEIATAKQNGFDPRDPPPPAETSIDKLKTPVPK